MKRDEKIKAIREGVRDLGREEDGKREVLLVNVRLRDLDDMVAVGMHGNDMLYAAGISLIDEDWQKPISELSDEDVDKLYEGMLEHAEWVKNHQD